MSRAEAITKAHRADFSAFMFNLDQDEVDWVVFLLMILFISLWRATMAGL